MPTSTITIRNTKKGGVTPNRPFPWQSILLAAIALALFGFALWMRLRDLGLPFDRDGYDEGVYWQSLRAMSAGNSLYQQIFYSQPPFFLLSVFPTYMFFGQTLWAARLGVALILLLALLGAFLLGKALSVNLGALATLLLLIVDSLYLMQSQTLEAESSYAAFSLPAVGLALLWWKYPSGITGICYAALAGSALSLSILCKHFGLATLIPIALRLLVHIWRIFQQEPEKRLAWTLSPLAGIIAFLVVTALVLLPFVHSWQDMIRGVISFHTAADSVYKYTQRDNLSKIRHALTSLTPLLALAALYGTLVALLRRNWLVLPLLAWFGATVILLWLQTPLFPHHFVALTPPLVALAALGFAPIQLHQFNKRFVPTLYNAATCLAILILLFVTVINWTAAQHYYQTERADSTTISVAKWDVGVGQDLQSVTQPDQLVITDAQFLAALANRSTGPQLVDTSAVRIDTHYLTAQQLITEASQPQVHTVLFYTGRLLRLKDINMFYTWLKQHFRLLHHYYAGKELWIKVS